LAEFGYPVQLSGIPAEKVVESMRLDKKSIDGAPRWVLLEDVAAARWGAEVPLTTVRELLTEA
jgi:3-dehydroquinate synthetase